jgi:hypothetical protein
VEDLCGAIACCAAILHFRNPELVIPHQTQGTRVGFSLAGEGKSSETGYAKFFY